MVVYELIKDVPFLNENPFVHKALDFPVPEGTQYSFWGYFLPTLIMGPLMYLVQALTISMLSGEHGRKEIKSGVFLYQARMAVTGIALSSPFISAAMMIVYNRSAGCLYSDLSSHSFVYNFVIAPLLWFFMADAIFYFGHRSCHIPLIYRLSHSVHHTCRPATSFAGNAADVFDLMVTGYANTVLPLAILPVHEKVFLFLAMFNQVWAVQLHCFQQFRVGYGIYDSHDHNVHHHFGRENYNFGLYFQLWDRLLGTYKAEVLSKKGTVSELYSTPLADDDEARQRVGLQYENS